MASADKGRFVVEGKDPNGKLFQTEVTTAEVRFGSADTPERHKTFEERSRRNIIEATNQFGGSVRRIKRVD